MFMLLSRSWSNDDFRRRRCFETCRGAYSLPRVAHAIVPAQRSVQMSKVERSLLAAPTPAHRLLLQTSTGRAEERVAKLVDSPDRPESEASYKLDEGGWSDV